eukprot:2164061-Prymnesium_polylepis.2
MGESGVVPGSLDFELCGRHVILSVVHLAHVNLKGADEFSLHPILVLDPNLDATRSELRCCPFSLDCDNRKSTRPGEGGAVNAHETRNQSRASEI